MELPRSGFCWGFEVTLHSPQGAGNHPQERTQLYFHLLTRALACSSRVSLGLWMAEGHLSSLQSLLVWVSLDQLPHLCFYSTSPHLSAPPDSPVAEKLCTPLCIDSILTLL